MRVLIVYAGRTGTTERAAKRLAAEIPHCTLRNLNETGASPERDYDVVVIGSAVRNLEIEPAVRKWLVTHERTLEGMKKAVFLCNAFLTDLPEIVSKNFPKPFLDECLAVDSFGGELPYERLGFSDRRTLKKLEKKHPETQVMVPCLLTDAIDTFAEKVFSAAESGEEPA